MDTKSRPRMRTTPALVMIIASVGSSVPFATVFLLTGMALPGLALAPVAVLPAALLLLLFRRRR